MLYEDFRNLSLTLNKEAIEKYYNEYYLPQKVQEESEDIRYALERHERNFRAGQVIRPLAPEAKEKLEYWITKGVIKTSGYCFNLEEHQPKYEEIQCAILSLDEKELIQYIQGTQIPEYISKIEAAVEKHNDSLRSDKIDIATPEKKILEYWTSQRVPPFNEPTIFPTSVSDAAKPLSETAKSTQCTDLLEASMDPYSAEIKKVGDTFPVDLSL